MKQVTKLPHENEKEKAPIVTRHATRKQLEEVTDKVMSQYKNALADLAKR